METMAYIFAMIAFLLGVVLLRKTNLGWKKSLAEWTAMEEIARTLSVAEREKKGKRLESEKRFARFQYRIRMNLGLSLILLGVFLVGYSMFMPDVIMQNAAKTQALVAVYCIWAMLVLALWLCFWGVVDCVTSYAYLSQKNASEVIEEERKYLRHAFANRNRDAKNSKKTDSDKNK